jgi:hypothetical protein
VKIFRVVTTQSGQNGLRAGLHSAPTATGRTPGSQAPAQPPAGSGDPERTAQRGLQGLPSPSKGSTGRDKTAQHSRGRPSLERWPKPCPAVGTQGGPHREGSRAAVPQQGQHGAAQDRTAQQRTSGSPAPAQAPREPLETEDGAILRDWTLTNSLAFRVPCVLCVDHPARRQRYCSATRTF